MALRKSDGKTHLDALSPAPTSARPFARNLIVHRLFAMDANRNVIAPSRSVTISPLAHRRTTKEYRYLPAGSWGTKCQGDKQDLPALWAGRGAAPHPGLPAEPSPHLNSVSHTLSGFWSPPARLTHRLSKEKAKKKKRKRKGKGKGKRKKKPSQAKMPVPSL